MPHLSPVPTVGDEDAQRNTAAATAAIFQSWGLNPQSSFISVNDVVTSPLPVSESLRSDLASFLAVLPPWLYAGLYTRLGAHLTHLTDCLIHRDHVAQFFFSPETNISPSGLDPDFVLPSAGKGGPREAVVVVTTRSIDADDMKAFRLLLGVESISASVTVVGFPGSLFRCYLSHEPIKGVVGVMTAMSTPPSSNACSVMAKSLMSLIGMGYVFV